MLVLQVALTPLEIYNDVQAHAACDLDAEHLVDKAQGDAEACLRKLIVQLATQVSFWLYSESLVITSTLLFLQAQFLLSGS